MKPFKIIIFMLLCTASLFSQQLDSRIAPTLMPLDDVATSILPPLDNDLLLQAELERRGPGIAPRFAEVVSVDISPETDGTWETLSNGNAVWRLRIQSAGAKSLNLGFTQFFMPAGGTLILYTANKKRVQGPFTPADNEAHEQLWTPVLDGDDLVIEVQLPEENRDDLQLNLTSVNHDFIGFNSIMSGSCNLDVICGEEDGWGIVEHYRDIIQSVGVISTGGTTFCTGFLVNNTRNDCTPYFMTANHCIGAGDAPSLVVFWNYVNSFCREPNSGASGGAGDGSLADFNTGSIFRASYATSDFILVELDDEVSSTANAFFAGWTADPDFSAIDTLIGIHHPSTDEKRISFDFDTPELSFYFDEVENPDADHVRVPDWDVGTTEGGSSGSPLFDNNKRVLGQLHGGGAACGNDLSDWYGAFAVSWEGGGTPSSRLKDWLDPDNTGLLTMDGRNQLQCSFFVLAEDNDMSICAPDEAVYTVAVSENFSGAVTLSANNVLIETNLNFSANPIMPGEETTLTVSNTNGIAPGTYTIELSGTDGIETSTSSIQLTVFDSSPAGTTLLEPANEAAGQILNPMFTWTDMGADASYHFQLSTDAGFTTIIFEASDLMDNNIVSTMLLSETTYFWRVTASNICGTGETSSVFSFSTAAISCTVLSAEDLPIVISEAGMPIIMSSIEINLPGAVVDVSISNLEILHTWVGDLSATLTSPNGTEINIFTEPQEGSCDGANLSLSFSDAAENTADDFINSCGDSPAITGSFQPTDFFSTFDGESASGTWVLTISDGADLDGGELSGWELNICTAIPDEASLFTNTTAFTICEGEGIDFDVLAGAGFDGDVMLSASGLPVGATVVFDTNPIASGSTANVTVTGINPSGDYDLVITATDGTNSTDLTITFNIESAPDLASLNSPSNGEGFTTPSIVLTWDGTDNTEDYLVEVSTTESFDNIIETATVTGLLYTLTELEAAGAGVYYWRVTARNECGAAITDFLTFVYTPLSVKELNGKKIDISPNPTAGELKVNLSSTAQDVVSIQVFNVNGKLLQSNYIKIGESQTIISLAQYTSGVYLLKLTDGNAHLTKRVVLQ